MPRRKRTSEMPEGSVPPFKPDELLPTGSPEAPAGADDGPAPHPLRDMAAFDLDAELGQIEAPGTKKAKEEPAEPAKKQTAEDKKKAADAEKKEKSRQAFLKAHPEVTTGAGIIARGAFATGAIIAREPLWNLTDEEERALAKAWQPVIAIYGPEWLLKFFPVLGALITTGQIIASKGQQISDKKEAAKEAKRKQVVDESARMVQEMLNAKAALEAAVNANAKQVPTAPQPEPQPQGA